MWKLTDLQRAVLQQIKTVTKENPITGASIAKNVAGYREDDDKPNANLRAVTHALREKDYPICSG